jgi:hypothetical protein
LKKSGCKGRLVGNGQLEISCLQGQLEEIIGLVEAEEEKVSDWSVRDDGSLEDIFLSLGD